MAEFQGSFLSFIKSDPKELKNYRNPVREPKSQSFLSVVKSDPKKIKNHRNPVPKPKPQPEVIDLEDDSNSEELEVVEDSQDDEQIIEAGLYEVVAEKDIEVSEGAQSVVMASVKKLVESREETYRRLESELKNLTRACQDDFLFQITDEEYDALFKHKAAYLNELNHQVRLWCSKNLQLYRVCGECGFKVTSAKEIRQHVKDSNTCATYYFALGTSTFPPNTMQCQECHYSTNIRFAMKRHQQAKGHEGIDKLTKDGQFVEWDVEQQEESAHEETEQEQIVQQDAEVQEVMVQEDEEVQEVVVQEDDEVQEVVVPEEVVQEEAAQNQVLVRESEEVPVPSSSTGFNDITMWPKDDDSGGIISNLQSRLEQQVENSDDHFIFRISNEEYAALCERRAFHMAKFGELVNIYCNKTLKLYQVCDGCGFATFLRKDMIKHFETGTCILSYFNALGTCDDDDPNKDAVEEESVQLTPIEDQFQITEVETTAIEVEPTEIEPAGVDRYLQPKIPKTEVNFRCPHCSSEMCIRNKHRHLKHHCPILLGKTTTVKHPIPQNKQCPHCTRSFQTTVRLNHHIRIVHNEQNRIEHKCETCQKQFKFDYLLQKHALKGCPGEKKKQKKEKVQAGTSSAARTPREVFLAVPMQCKDCLIFFVSTADLFRHQKNYCKAHHMRTAPLETVIKVEPTRLGGGLGQG